MERRRHQRRPLELAVELLRLDRVAVMGVRVQAAHQSGKDRERLAAADDVIENHNGSEMAIKTRILALHETYLAIASQQGRQV